jgi:hypothetical protein
VTESEEILSQNYYIYFIFYNICSDMTGEHDTTDSNDMEASMAETRRGK